MEKIKLLVGKKTVIDCLSNKELNKTRNLVIHIPAVYMSCSCMRYFNIPYEYNFTVLCVELIKNNNNNLKETRYNRYYLNIIHSIINKIKSLYPNIKKIILTGESWGANLAMIYARKYFNNIDGIVCWNGCRKVITILDEKSRRHNFFTNAWKHVLSLLFNCNFYSTRGNISQLTDNDIFIRLSKIKKMNLEANTSSRVNLAVWFSMRPAWKSLKKIFKMNQKLPFTYIQSQQDVYYKVNKFDVEKIKKNSNGYNNLILVKKGYHLLSLDQYNNDQIIWKSINKMFEDK